MEPSPTRRWQTISPISETPENPVPVLLSVNVPSSKVTEPGTGSLRSCTTQGAGTPLSTTGEADAAGVREGVALLVLLELGAEEGVAEGVVEGLIWGEEDWHRY